MFYKLSDAEVAAREALEEELQEAAGGGDKGKKKKKGKGEPETILPPLRGQIEGQWWGRGATSLTYLDLSQNQFGDAGCAALLAVLYPEKPPEPEPVAAAEPVPAAKVRGEHGRFELCCGSNALSVWQEKGKGKGKKGKKGKEPEAPPEPDKLEYITASLKRINVQFNGGGDATAAAVAAAHTIVPGLQLEVDAEV